MNASIAFSVPADGASAELSSATANTDANGDASVTATANAMVGSYLVAANAAGVDATPTFALSNTIDSIEVIFVNGFDPPGR